MKVGFIGGGNMASAMIGGMIQKGVVSADDILVSVRTEKSVERLTNQFGVQATMENEAVVAGSDLVFLAVKPNQIKNIINLVKNFISPEKIIVSILPGKSLQWLGTEIGKPTKLIRTMPNTPALVGEGMTGVCANDLVTEEELQLVLTLLKSFGRAEVVPEYLMDTVTGVQRQLAGHDSDDDVLVQSHETVAPVDGRHGERCARPVVKRPLGGKNAQVEGSHPSSPPFIFFALASASSIVPTL